MKNLVIVAIGLALYVFLDQNSNPVLTPPGQTPSASTQIASAFANRQSDVQVSGSGVVVRTLPDDTKGSRHQKFILRLSSGQTLLISHNIDLAPRINSLRAGDHVEFYGEYEWNSRGGVVHWTHHDPNGRHEHGWLRHKGVVFQ